MRTVIKRLFTASTLLLACLVSQWTSAQPAQQGEGPFDLYEVPAISSVKRLPDTAPTDGRLSSQLRVIAAKGEFEPASFIISPREDIAELVLEATDLSGDGGVIPAANVDIRVVKVWYQGGTSWYSYFGDSNRRELVPELLLKDETLVKVDMENQENYLRVGGEYQWISYPHDKAEKFFNYLAEPVADSKTLQPVALKTDECKQFWVTVKVPEDADAGIYRGKINLTAGGEKLGAMTLAVRVLPFQLPMPKTYYNLDNDFLITVYGTGIYEMSKKLAIPLSEADRMQKAIYRNLLDHNVFNVRSDLTLTGTSDREKAMQALRHEIQAMKEAGLVTKPLLSRGWGYWSGHETDNMEAYQSRIDALAKTLKDAVGHDDIYITSWDEAGPGFIRIMRPLLEYAHKAHGLKVWLTTRAGHHFDMEGYLINYANHGGWPDKAYADKWHSIGAKVASYAGPHSGVENPVVYRRFEGLSRYKANYDGSFNYMYFTTLHTGIWERQKVNVWNDFQGGAYRRFNFVYPTTGGPIDTLAWEGFREGIDDIRYATKLKQDAAAAIASDNPEAGFVAKKALIWLELLDDKTADLNAVRMEMIHHILKIQEALKR